MKKLLGVMIVLGAAVALTMGAAGCNKPAATKDKTTPPAAAGGKKDVTVAGPTTDTTMKQGESKDIALTLTRGAEATKEATVTAEVDPKDKGVTADTVKIAGDKKEGTLKVTATDTATEGDYTITLTAKSDDSKDSTAKVKVKVGKK